MAQRHATIGEVIRGSLLRNMNTDGLTSLCDTTSSNRCATASAPGCTSAPTA